MLPALARQFKCDLNAPWADISPAARKAILHGDASHNWEGVLANIERRYRESSSDTVRMELDEYMIGVDCDACSGFRLKPESLAVTIAGKNIGEITALAVTESLEFFKGIPVRK